MEGPEISIVVPVHDEEGQIASFVTEIDRILGAERFEVLFVDDGSSDGSWTAVQVASENDPRVGGVRLTRNFGKESAIWAGLDAARGGAVIVIDADFEHPPKLLPAMIEAWRSGCLLVEARRKRRAAEPRWYRALSALFYWTLGSGTGFDFRGSTDFKLLDRRVVEVLRDLPERVTFFRGMVSWTGFDRRVIEFDPPAAGRPTRWSVLRLLRFSVDAVTSFTPWPLFLVAVAGALFALFAVLLGAQTLYMYLSGRAVTGFTTVILLILIAGSIIMSGIGILGLYVSRLFEEVKRRPRSIRSDAIVPGSRPSPIL